jgi:hypothetical protein
VQGFCIPVLVNKLFVKGGNWRVFGIGWTESPMLIIPLQ